jgi:hypothetical protein
MSPSAVRIVRPKKLEWGEKMNTHSILVGKPIGKWTVGRQRRRCENNIKTDHWKHFVRMGGGWNSLRAVSNYRL